MNKSVDYENSISRQKRAQQGIHYTPVQCIHKVIDPLFLTELTQELAVTADTELPQYIAKLSALTFLDPACGSGNFLIEIYTCLRQLEAQALARLKCTNRSQVKLAHFLGFELDPAACEVATNLLNQTKEDQDAHLAQLLNCAVQDITATEESNSIKHCNALHEDWSAYQVDYIIGNPPFIGSSKQDAVQKADVKNIFQGWDCFGLLDYVACWFKLAADYMKEHPKTKTALVSTNSICQGEQVNVLWTPLFNDYKAHIDFAYHRFKWQNAAQNQAHVVVIIVGFSCGTTGTAKLFKTKDEYSEVDNINGYLLNYKNIAVHHVTKPLTAGVSPMILGNRPTDGGALIIEKEDYADFIAREPGAIKWIKKLVGADELIKGKDRYCLWLKDATQADIDALPAVKERVNLCRKNRTEGGNCLKSFLSTPHLFGANTNAPEHFLAVPIVSSENRDYIPTGYFDNNTIPKNQIHTIPNATIYDFGIVNSIVHMVWMKTVCGRMKTDYSYSNTLVYNTFPRPTPTDEQRALIEQTAQGILDARAKYPGKSLKELYDKATMPKDLLAAHKANDDAVRAAYGWDEEISENDILVKLFEMYEQLIANQPAKKKNRKKV